MGQASDAVKLLQPDDFSLSAHRAIFAAIKELVRCGDCVIDYSLLAAALGKNRALDEVGGAPYLTGLDLGVVPEIPIESRVRYLRPLAERRRLLKLLERGIEQLADPGTDTDETKSWLLEMLK